MTNTSIVKKTLVLFVVWRTFLFLPFVLNFLKLTLQETYLGGSAALYKGAPLLWSWANFDGQHYLSIAKFGYRPLTYFFFPVYPLLMRYLGNVLGNTDITTLVSGLVISNVALVVGLIGLIKLIKLDFANKSAFFTVTLLLLFPTSFFLGSLYTESLFLALVVWAFYFARSGKWELAIVLAAISTATRVVGIVMLPALAVEIYQQYKSGHVQLQKAYLLLFIPLGLLLYMLFLQRFTGDPLAFFHSVEIFGQQRSTQLVILPQVFYRYIFKIIPSLSLYMPVIVVTWLEFIIGIIFFAFAILSFFKLRLSYTVYALGAYLMPPLSGSFSSFPRYVLVIFPCFVVMAILLQKLPRSLQVTIEVGMVLMLFIAESLFIKGYWVS